MSTKNKSDLLKSTEQARRYLDAAVENNFGYVGNCPSANRRLDQLRVQERKLKEGSPEEYEIYANKYY